MAKEIWHGKYKDLGSYYKQFNVASDEEIVVIKRKKDPFSNQPQVPKNKLSEPEQEQEKEDDFSYAEMPQAIIKPQNYPKEHLIIAKLRSILKDNTRVKTHKNKDYGDICHKNLYKISTNGKVFQRKQQLNAKKYIVQLLVDTSGSMKNISCEMAIKAVEKIVINFQDLVDIEILTFNERSIKLKDQKEKKVNKLRMEKITSAIKNETDSYHNGATLTMTGVKTALKSLNSLHYRNLTKIMVIITDGGVNFNGSLEENRDNFSKLLQQAKASGIKIMGLGIYTDAIACYLPKSSIVIDKVEAILPALLTLLKNAIGGRKT